MGRLRLGTCGLLGLAMVSLAGALVAPPIDAKTSFDSPYTLGQTYNGALRMIRVDLGLKILERDPEVAYVVFEYRSTEGGARAVPGSIEMVDTGRAVKVVVQIPQMPRYHEQVLVDRLNRKLREEYGEPLRKSDRTPPDGGADAASGLE